MKTIESYSALSRNARAAVLKTEVAVFSKGQKIIAKILFAAEAAGDFEPGEKTNSFAQRVTGCELRRECQGVYEALRVLTAMRDKTVTMTEEQFDGVRGFSLIIISGLISKKDPVTLARAVKIALSGDKDTVAQLKALTAKAKKAPGAKDPSKTPPLENNEVFPDLSDLNVKTYTVADEMNILDHPEIGLRIVNELKQAGSIEDCETFLVILQRLGALAEKRKSALIEELPTAKSKKAAKAAQLQLVA